MIKMPLSTRSPFKRSGKGWAVLLWYGCNTMACSR